MSLPEIVNDVNGAYDEVKSDELLLVVDGNAQGAGLEQVQKALADLLREELEEGAF